MECGTGRASAIRGVTDIRTVQCVPSGNPILRLLTGGRS